jgi:spermidine/putrescine transport system ATP-binding protein
MLELLNIGKSFSKQVAVSGVSLKIERGEFFSLLGPSGCGKTTLLRMIAGLEEVSEGQMLLEGQGIGTLPARTRPFNMVFQRYALFPHLSVAENIAYGLKIRKKTAEQIHHKVSEVLKLVDMTEFRERRPETLSGGQAQRVAIARALVNEPKLLLLDEPLSALDQKLREHMQRELRLLQKQLGIAFIYVTHDQEEALNMSDRIGLMSLGRLTHVGKPQDLFENPNSEFSRPFSAGMSFLHGEFVEMRDELAVVRLADGSLVRGRCQTPEADLRPGMKLNIFVRKALIAAGSPP